MFSDVMIGFLAGVGFAAWVYAKMQRQTGGNTSNSLIVAAGSGFILFLLVLVLMRYIVPR